MTCMCNFLIQKKIFGERFGKYFGKPQFPSLQDVLGAEHISDLVGPSSWSILDAEVLGSPLGTNILSKVRKGYLL